MIQQAVYMKTDSGVYARYPIKTPVIKAGDDLAAILAEDVKFHSQRGDILFISEKCVACAQGRAVRLGDIKPRPLAAFLSRFVRRSPYGIGLAMPETMEIAIRECGAFRILMAACAGAVGRLLGIKGWFYRVAGRKAAAVDGPCPNTLPPYNQYVVPAPQGPEKVCRELYERLGLPVAIVDVNDLGAEVMAIWPSDMDMGQLAALLRDNPLGQSSQQTPAGILRKMC